MKSRFAPLGLLLCLPLAAQDADELEQRVAVLEREKRALAAELAGAQESLAEQAARREQGEVQLQQALENLRLVTAQLDRSLARSDELKAELEQEQARTEQLQRRLAELQERLGRAAAADPEAEAEEPASSREVVRPSGLRYQELAPGQGEACAPGRTVRVHYTGRLEDGSTFDSSRGKEPIEFVLGAGQVIEGWEEGLVGMKVGGRRRLTVPPQLGYGSRGVPELIPPDATLVFEVELVGLE